MRCPSDCGGQCRGNHPHVPLKGFVRDARGRKVFATKLAQVYPDKLCQVVARSVVQVVQGTLPQFTASFQLQDQGPARKRALGSERSWKEHRQHQAALLAASAGYQLKRGAAKPLLQSECELGQAIQWSLQVVHPFTVPPQLLPQLMTNIKFMIAQPRELVQHCAHLLQFWTRRAQELTVAPSVLCNEGGIQAQTLLQLSQRPCCVQ